MTAETGTKRRGISPGVVLLGLLLLFAAVVGGLWFAYQKMVAYERRAALHLPAGTRLAARIDLEQVVLFEPFRKNLFPVLRHQLASSANDDGVAELERTTGVELAMDLREVVFAVPQQKLGWLLIVGGLFPDDGLAAGLGQLLQSRGITDCSMDGPRLTCSKSGLFIQQADDAALLIAPSPQLIDAAMAPTTEYQRIGLGIDDAAGFAMDGAWVRDAASALSSPLLARFTPGMQSLQQFGTVTGQVELGSESTLHVQLRPLPGGSLHPLAEDFRKLLDGVGRMLALVGHTDVAGERTLLAAAQISPGPDGRIDIVSPWSRQDMDRAAASLADALAAWARGLAQEPASH